MKVVATFLLAISSAFVSGCGVNIVKKSESSETPIALKSLSVITDRQSFGRYTISKVITSYGGEKAEVSEANRATAQAIASQAATVFPTSIENGISKQLQNRNVVSGADYRLVIALTGFQIRFHGDPGLLKFTSSFIDLEYSATLFRVTDTKQLWKASFRRPNGSTSPDSVKSIGDEIAEKVFAEFAGSGWIPAK